MKKFQARQGDIFFKEVAAPPANLKKFEGTILAYGEVTGHSHKLKEAPTESYVDTNGDIYIRGGVSVGHDEHSVINLPADTWVCVTRQREYDPLAEDRQRKVAD